MGERMNPWMILNIEKTDDKDAVKKAYMQMLKKNNPEDDPEGFQKIRQAYENALAEIEGKKDGPSMSAPVAGFIKKMEELYKNFPKRIVQSNWEELFRDDVCLHLELEDELLFFVLDFFAVNSLLPAYVWQIVIKKLNIEAQKEKLKVQFGPGYIDYILGFMKGGTQIFDYELFDTSQEKDFDRAIFLRGDICYHLDGKNVDEAEKLLKELEELEIHHPNFLLENARFLALKNEPAKALEIVENLFEKYDFKKNSYAMFVKGSILMAFDDEEHLNQSAEVCRTILTEYPDYYYVQDVLMEVLIKLGKLEEALDYVMDEILAKYPSSPAMGHAARVNDLLMKKNEEKYAQNPKDNDTVMALADNFIKSHRYENAYDLLMKHNDIRTHKYFRILSISCLEKRDYEKAIEYAEQSNNLQPNYGAYLDLTDALTAQKKYTKALETADYAFSLNLPTNGYDIIRKARLFISKSSVCKNLKEYEKAIAVLDSALEINNKIDYVYAIKAEIYKEIGNYNEAIEQAETALSFFPYNVQPYETMVEIFYNSGNPEQVDAIISRAAQFQIDSPGLKFYKACCLSKEKKTDEAMKILSELKNAEEKWAERTFIELYYIYHDDMRKPKNSFDCLTEGLKKLPNNEMLLIRLAEHYKMHKPKKEIDVWKDILRHYPENQTAINRFALILEDSGKPEGAIEFLDKKIMELPQSINLRIRRAFIFKEMEKHKNALDDFFYAEENGKNMRIWWDMNQIYFEIAHIYSTKLNDAPNALKYFELALNENSNDMYTHFYIGNLYTYFYKNHEKAVGYYNAAIELDEGDHMNFYHRGISYQCDGKFDLAKNDFLQVVKMCVSKDLAKSITYHGDYTYMAQAYIMLGEHKKAYTAIKKAASLVKRDGTKKRNCYCIYMVWAQYFQGIGKKNKARKYIEIAVSISNSVMNNDLKSEIYNV